MNLLIFLLLIVIIAMLMFRGSAEGSGEVKVNRKTHKGRIVLHANKDFTSFVEKLDSPVRLICVVGADLSGRTYLAKMIEKSKKFHYIEEHDAKGRTEDIPRIREQFYVEINDLSGAAREAAQAKAGKFIVSGNFTVDDLNRLFKGDPINKNFVLIFVQPRKKVSQKWKSATGLGDAEYTAMLKAGDAMLKALSANFTVNVVKNKFAEVPVKRDNKIKQAHDAAGGK